jgi:hypothetical protein
MEVVSVPSVAVLHVAQSCELKSCRFDFAALCNPLAIDESLFRRFQK